MDVRTHDIVTINDSSARVEYIGTGDYAIYVVTPEGDRFALDHSELALTAPRHGQPATWGCWTDDQGRRA